MSASPLQVLLRDPALAARRALDGEGTRELAAASIAAVALAGAVFGGVLGSYRGGVQVAYAAFKMPLVLLISLGLAVPAFHGLSRALGRRWSLRAASTLVLAASARAGLVLLALSPLLWLAIDLGLGYHLTALVATACFGLAGVAALGVYLRGIGRGRGALVLAVSTALVLLAIEGQTGWMLRPYLVRPQTQEVPFIRDREGSFVDAVLRSGWSSLGLYSRRDITQEDWPAQSGARGSASAPDWTGEELYR